MTTVTVYTTGPACPQCALTEKVMAAAGIAFTEVDLTQEFNGDARDYVTGDLGYAQAPVVVVDDQDHWSGFRPDLIKRLADHLETRAMNPLGSPMAGSAATAGSIRDHVADIVPLSGVWASAVADRFEKR